MCLTRRHGVSFPTKFASNRSLIMKIKNTILLTVVASAVCSGAAMADSVNVKHGDLNLSSPADAKVLYQRIVAAANQLCPEYGYNSVIVERNQHAAAKACREAAIAGAVRSVPSTALASIHSSHISNAVDVD
jgi:UrcA family protein